jgi:hypothetical protein
MGVLDRLQVLGIATTPDRMVGVWNLASARRIMDVLDRLQVIGIATTPDRMVGVWNRPRLCRNGGCLGSSVFAMKAGVWDRRVFATNSGCLELPGIWNCPMNRGCLKLPRAWNHPRSRAIARRFPAAELGDGGEVEHPIARVRRRRAARPPGDAPARSGRVIEPSGSGTWGGAGGDATISGTDRGAQADLWIDHHRAAAFSASRLRTRAESSSNRRGE